MRRSTRIHAWKYVILTKRHGTGHILWSISLRRWCLLYQHKDLERIKEELTKMFPIHVTSLWITSWQFTLDRIKLNLSFFQPKIETKKVGTLDTNYEDIKIKRYSQVRYLRCELDKNLTGEAKALKVICKVSKGLGSPTGKLNYPHIWKGS